MRKVERPHPVNPVRNPYHPEMWLTEQQKRNFDNILNVRMTNE